MMGTGHEGLPALRHGLTPRRLHRHPGQGVGLLQGVGDRPEDLRPQQPPDGGVVQDLVRRPARVEARPVGGRVERAGLQDPRVGLAPAPDQFEILLERADGGPGARRAVGLPVPGLGDIEETGDRRHEVAAARQVDVGGRGRWLIRGQQRAEHADDRRIVAAASGERSVALVVGVLLEVGEHGGAVARQPGEVGPLFHDLLIQALAAVDRSLGIRGGPRARDAREAHAGEAQGLEHHRQLGVVAEVVGHVGEGRRQAQRRPQPGPSQQVVAEERLAVRQQAVRGRDPAALDAELRAEVLLVELGEEAGVGLQHGAEEAHLADRVHVGGRRPRILGHQPPGLLDDLQDRRLAGVARLDQGLERVEPVPVHVGVHAEDEDASGILRDAESVANPLLDGSHIKILSKTNALRTIQPQGAAPPPTALNAGRRNDRRTDVEIRRPQ